MAVRPCSDELVSCARDCHDDRQKSSRRSGPDKDVLHHRQLLVKLDAGTGDGDEHGERGGHGSDPMDDLHSDSFVDAPLATYCCIGTACA